MASTASLSACSVERLEVLAGQVLPARSSSLPALWLPLREEDGKVVETAVVYLIYVRTNGFMVALPALEEVSAAFGALVTEAGVPTVLSDCTLQCCTARGRAVGGTYAAYLADVPGVLADRFYEVPNPRLTGYRTVVQSSFRAEDGQPLRPTAEAALAAGEQWIGGEMDHDTAEDYMTGQEVPPEPEEDFPGTEEEPDRVQLLARIAELEGEVKKSKAAASARPAGVPTVAPGFPSVPQPQTMFRADRPGARQLDAADWNKLHQLAGPVPIRTSAAQRTTALQPLAVAADSSYAELEKEVIEEDTANDILKMFEPQSMDTNQQLMLAQLKQNSLLLQGDLRAVAQQTRWWVF